MKTRVMKQQLRQEIAPAHPYNPMLFDAVYEALDELEWLRAENARIAEELEAAIKIIREAKV